MGYGSIRVPLKRLGVHHALRLVIPCRSDWLRAVWFSPGSWKSVSRVLICPAVWINYLVFADVGEPELLSIPGRSSVWLERLVRDQEAGGSNPLAPSVVENKPFGENVEGLSHLRGENYAAESEVQTADSRQLLFLAPG